MSLLSRLTGSTGSLLTLNKQILIGSALRYGLLIESLGEAPLDGVSLNGSNSTTASIWVLVLMDELDILTRGSNQALLLGGISGILIEARDHSVFVGEIDDLGQLTLQVTVGDVVTIDSFHVLICRQLDNLILLSPSSTGEAVVRVLSLALEVGDLELVNPVSSLAFDFAEVLSIDATCLVVWILDVACWACLAPS